MARVICDMSISLDGDVTGRNDSREHPFGDGAEGLHDWIFAAATDEDRGILQEMLDDVGAIVMAEGRSTRTRARVNGVVGLHGASVMQQALPLGLVDEIRVHVMPVLLGGGTPPFATLGSAIRLERTQALATPATTHLGFRVLR